MRNLPKKSIIKTLSCLVFSFCINTAFSQLEKRPISLNEESKKYLEIYSVDILATNVNRFVPKNPSFFLL